MPDPNAAEVTSLEFTIEADGDCDTIMIPQGLIGLLAEEDESAPRVVGDIVLFSCAQRVHAVVHHSEGQVTDDLLAIEAQMLAQFEERFGMTFEEATGHSG